MRPNHDVSALRSAPGASRPVATRLRGALAAGFALAQLFACANAPRDQTSVLAGSAARNLLILPFNVAMPMPSELDALSSIVWRELETYLERPGRKLKTVSFRDARRLWLDSIRKVRAGEGGAHAGYDDANRVLVLELARSAEFDTAIVPSLVIRPARISGRTASWDGVERELEIEANGLEAKRIATETPLEGSAPAASLYAVVLDAKGNKLQESQGGIDLLVRVRVEGGGSSSSGEASVEFAPRADLFANREHIREGIAQALSPILPPQTR